MLFTTTFDDVSTILPKSCIFMFDSTSRASWNNGDNNKHKPSGVIVLGIFSLLCSQRSSGNLWGEDKHLLLKRIKKNIINKVNNHNDSVGEYYSFGNKAF